MGDSRKPVPAAAGKAVTSYDVAARVGVSQSAVSRALTPGGSVSPRTRARIMQAIEELGYQPNAIARSLITQRSNMVAIIVANLDFHPELTAHLSRAFADRGKRVLLFTLEHESDADRIVDEIWQYRVDGVIAAVTLPPNHIELLAARKTPLIFLNRDYADVPTCSVCCNHVEGERLLVRRLIGAGYRRFGIIRGPADSVVGVQRVDEAILSLREAGVFDVALADGEFDYASGRAAMRKLAHSAAARPEVVICANDMMACGAMDAARHDLGLDVPGDIGVVGFDGLAQAAWASYDLVTVRQPTRSMVLAAVEMLLARLANPALGPEKRVFSGELSAGSSARI
jgi:DNA-binding LacI/PurR family transcriptional regulator